MGLLREQYVRSSSRPAIVELNDYPMWAFFILRIYEHNVWFLDQLAN